MQFVITAEHEAQLCPTANATTRKMIQEGAAAMPELAEKLGVGIVTLNVFGPDHVIVGVVEAADVEAVREFLWQSCLIQWNKVRVNATWSFEDAVARLETLPTIF